MFVSMEERMYRVGVVECFQGAGIPLEKNGLKLTHSSHLSDLYSLFFDARTGECAWGLKAIFISCIFDGTARNGEALAFVVCFIKK